MSHLRAGGSQTKCTESKQIKAESDQTTAHNDFYNKLVRWISLLFSRQIVLIFVDLLFCYTNTTNPNSEAFQHRIIYGELHSKDLWLLWKILTMPWCGRYSLSVWIYLQEVLWKFYRFCQRFNETVDLVFELLYYRSNLLEKFTRWWNKNEKHSVNSSSFINSF